MKKALILSFISLMISNTLYNCSCIPPSSQINGIFILDKIQSPSGIKSYQDSLYLLSFSSVSINGKNLKQETYLVNEMEVSQKTWQSVEEDFCQKGSKRNVFVTYEDGDKRMLLQDRSDPMRPKLEVTNILPNNELDSVTYFYKWQENF